MKKRWIGWAVWLLLTACLYFFENGTGTRIILLCSLLLPLIPALRAAFFGADQTSAEEKPEALTLSSFTRREEDEPGDIRPYVPGDPLRRIHWKLSAKKDELLIREPSVGTEVQENRLTVFFPIRSGKSGSKKRFILFFAALSALCLILLAVIPDALRGAQALCNRLFAASEAVNAYAYSYFPVPDGQSVTLAVLLLILPACFLAALPFLTSSRLVTLGLAASCTLFQVYFGLPFPGWVNVPLYGLLAVRLMKRPLSRKSLLAFGVFLLIVALLTLILLPGVHVPTETVSEKVRDQLSRLARQLSGVTAEAPIGESETRHIHPRSLEEGEKEALAGQEFRLVTSEEEQISQPRWINWLKIILLLLLSCAVVILPFIPFLILNERKKRAREIRKTFQSEDTAQAVCAIFRQIILWLEATRTGAGNRLYRDWAFFLPEGLPEGYADRFSRCAADFEEASYSGRAPLEEKREDALRLLEETESFFWNKAGLKEKFLLKYWMCLCE